jgi:hypothetical protein
LLIRPEANLPSAIMQAPVRVADFDQRLGLEALRVGQRVAQDQAAFASVLPTSMVLPTCW